MTGGLREAALAWAARGFRVFPLEPGGKIPIAKGWTDWATSDADKVHAMWTDSVTGFERDFNIGCLTDGLIVSDVDVKNGKDGWASFMELDLPTDTLTVETPSGGAHVYYSGPSRSNSAGRLGSGLDIRSHHGFVVAPGSRTEAGTYRVVVDLPVLDCPAALLARLDAPRDRSDQAPLTDLDAPDAVLRAVEWLEAQAPLAIEGQSGDATTFKVAATLKDFGLTIDTALSVMLGRWNERCLPPWGGAELRSKIENAYAYGTSAPGSASPHADMEGVQLEDPSPASVDKTSNWFWHGDAYDKDALWTLFEVLPKTGVCVLVAPSGSGKTFLLLEWARCLATEKPFFGVKAESAAGAAFVFGGTEGTGFERRLEALGEEQRLPIAGTKVTTLGVRGALSTLLEDLKLQDAEMRLRFDVGLGVIIVETLSATGLVDDENDNAKMAQAVANLATISRAMGAPVIVSHHPTKDGRSARGGGSLIANADYVYEVIKEGRSSAAYLDMTKARDVPLRRLGAFTLLPVHLGVDSRGREISSATVSMSNEPIKDKVRSNRTPPHFELFMECLEWALADEGRKIGDAQCVDLEAVRELFKERKPGSKDRGNISTAFKNTKTWAEESGAIRVVLEGSKHFLARGGLSDA